MAQQVVLNVDDEVKVLGDVIGGLIADVKAGKTVLQDFEDAIAQLVVSVSAFSNLGADIKKVDNQAYLLKSLADALEPKA
jgi:hypothetical protein